MKLKVEILFTVAVLFGTAFAVDSAKDEPKPAPAAAEEVETDEIDLDKFDDSADAARKAPTVKMAPQTAATANSVAAVPTPPPAP